MQLAFNFIKKKFELSFKRKRRSLFLTTTDTTTDKKNRKNVLTHFVRPSRWMQDLFIVELKQSNIFLI